MVKQHDKIALVREAEREQIRKEVEARFQAEASDFVAVQIQQATDHLKSQFESELQARINALHIGAQSNCQVPQVEMHDESQQVQQH